MGSDYVLFNLSIDDVHPESSGYLSDCGGDKEAGKLRYIIDLINDYPDLKVTLFVTPNWIDRPNDAGAKRLIKKVLKLPITNTWSDSPFRLDKHVEWCSWLNDYVDRGVFEVGVHGFTHHYSGSDVRVNHSSEFSGLSCSGCMSRLMSSEAVFKRANLRFSKVFRPPGWGACYELLEALKKLGYVMSCRSLSLIPEVVHEVINIPPNWNIGRDTIEKGIKLAGRYGVITAYGHVTDSYGSEYLEDGLNEVNLLRLRVLLNELASRFRVLYVTLSEVAQIALGRIEYVE